MKKTILILLSLLLVFTTFGCKKEDKDVGDGCIVGTDIYYTDCVPELFLPDVVLIKNLYNQGIKFGDEKFESELKDLNAIEDGFQRSFRFYGKNAKSAYDRVAEKNDYIIPIVPNGYRIWVIRIEAKPWTDYDYMGIYFRIFNGQEGDDRKSIYVDVYDETDPQKIPWITDGKNEFEEVGAGIWKRKSDRRDRYDYLLKANNQYLCLELNFEPESPEKLFDYVTFDEYSVTHLGATKIRSYQSIEDLSPSEE